MTILETGDRLLRHEDADAADVIATALRDDGVDLRIGLGATCLRRDDDIIVALADGSEIATDAILVAAGRTPNTAALDCPQSSIELDAHGFVQTDAHLRTTCEGVFAIGEVAKQPAFTHVAWEDYRRVTAVLAGTMRTKDDRVLGYSTFTEPQLAHVGLNEAAALAAGHQVRVATIELSDVARGIEWNLSRGFYRLVIEAGSNRILGATCVGYEAGEIVHTILAHMEAKSTWQLLEQSVHIHPTFSEALPTLAREFV